ncbi:MAG TPA: tetratricopeptide repeat protein [Phycisphaerales bacterium]|nr:tetratricopeptide repeat protein [Phycisphaerales bacterium]
MNARTTLRLGLTACICLAGFGAGCGGGGHGKYTREHLSAAREKLSIMKSATEHDMARQAFLAGDLDKALKRIDTSIAINDQVARSHVLRGRILNEMGALDQAVHALRAAESLDATNVEAQFYLGVLFERLQEQETALGHYRRAMELDPTAPQYAVAAAETLIDMGRTAEAETLLREGGGRYEHAAGVKQTLGHIALMAGRNAEAVELFNQARLLAPDDVAILEDLVRAQVSVQDYRAAESNLARLLKDSQRAGRRDLLHSRARCLTELARPVEARTIYITLTEGDEGAGDLEAWIGLGELSYVLKDQHRLRAAATRVIAIAPERADGYLLRALWHRRQNENAAALEWLGRAAARDPSSAKINTLRGLVLRDMGRHDAARESFTLALKADPTNASLRALLDSVGGATVAGVPNQP